MTAKSMMPYVEGNSAIRAMFEEGARLAAQFGKENVYDFSLGNPSVPAPDAVNQAIVDILNEEDTLFVHGYNQSNSGYEDVRQVVAEHLNKLHGTSFSSQNIVMTVGAASGLNVAIKTLVDPGEEILAFAPYFVEYGNYAKNHGAVLKAVPADTMTFQPNLEAMADMITANTRAVIINSPNNPTGVTSGRDFLTKTLTACEKHNAILVIDECFNEFIDDPQSLTMKKALEKTGNLLILKAFTKVFAMAGVRLGYALCSDEKVINGIRNAGQPWAVSGLAQAAGIAALGEPEYVTRLSDMVRRERSFLYEGITSLGLKVIPGEANYLLFRASSDFEQRMRKEGILIRDCSNYPGLGEGWFRTAVRTREDNEILLEKMKKVL